MGILDRELNRIKLDLSRQAEQHRLLVDRVNHILRIAEISEQQSIRQHSITGSAHTAAGLTIGWVIRATGANSFEWQELQYTDLGSRSHVLADNTGLGPDHSMSGASVGNVLRASGATAAQFAQLQHGDLGGTSVADHHAAFIGLEDNAATPITPALDYRIQITDDTVINADAAGGNKLHLSLTQSGINHDLIGGVSPNDHHAQQHVLTGADHTASGLTIGWVVRATGAGAFAWQELQHGDLGGLGSDDHHAQSHILATTSGLGPDHSVSSLIEGQYLRAISPTEAAFSAIQAVDLPGLSSFAGDGLVWDGSEFDVGAGTLITVGLNDVGLSNAAAGDRMILSAQGSPFTPAYYPAATLAGILLDWNATSRAFDVDEAGITHNDIGGGTDEDAHHTAFVGLESNSGTIVTPAVDNRIRFTDDGIVNADANVNEMAFSISEAQITHDNLGGLTANNHHNRDHVLATGTALGTTHAISGAADGQFLRAYSTTGARFDPILAGDLPTGTADAIVVFSSPEAVWIVESIPSGPQSGSEYIGGGSVPIDAVAVLLTVVGYGNSNGNNQYIGFGPNSSYPNCVTIYVHSAGQYSSNTAWVSKIAGDDYLHWVSSSIGGFIMYVYVWGYITAAA